MKQEKVYLKRIIHVEQTLLYEKDSIISSANIDHKT